MGRTRMATPSTCCALKHRFQGLSMNHGSPPPSPNLKEESCFSETTTQQQNQSTSQKWPVEIKSQPALPTQWEQFLDLKTGELYYYDGSAGRKTQTDPRGFLRVPEKMLHEAKTLAERSEIDESSITLHYSEVEDDNNNSSGFESMEEDSDDSEESQKEVCEGRRTRESDAEGSSSQDSTVLVAVGCQNCLMYYMLPKYALSCPKCGTAVLHFNEPATSKGNETQQPNVR